MKCNSESEAFLSLLDPKGTDFTFQTFDNRKGRKDRDLIRLLHGPLERHCGEFLALNRRGAGIYVTVNETDVCGRRT